MAAEVDVCNATYSVSCKTPICFYAIIFAPDLPICMAAEVSVCNTTTCCFGCLQLSAHYLVAYYLCIGLYMHFQFN